MVMVADRAGKSAAQRRRRGLASPTAARENQRGRCVRRGGREERHEPRSAARLRSAARCADRRRRPLRRRARLHAGPGRAAQDLCDRRDQGRARRHLGPVPLPGHRSDSDLFTFAYDFKPWKSRKAIASGDEILAYIREAAAEHGVLDHIRYPRKVVAADWDGASALWSVRVRPADGAETIVRCRWLFGATGYYDYDQGYRPRFPDEEAFAGPILHPQAWPDDFDPAGKRIAVIGSGATAVTLVPALAEAGAEVTQIQRTPGYVLPIPSEDAIADFLRRWLSGEARACARAAQEHPAPEVDLRPLPALSRRPRAA